MAGQENAGTTVCQRRRGRTYDVRSISSQEIAPNQHVQRFSWIAIWGRDGGALARWPASGKLSHTHGLCVMLSQAVHAATGPTSARTLSVQVGRLEVRPPGDASAKMSQRPIALGFAIQLDCRCQRSAKARPSRASRASTGRRVSTGQALYVPAV
nr:hypothetical protein CFP56_00714 [Quercus suber]